jgi:hypothetical protein
MVNEELLQNITTYIKERVAPDIYEELEKLIKMKGYGYGDREAFYRKASIDKQLYSKINIQRHASKETVLKLGFALELNKNELIKLLSTAGYALIDSCDFDLVLLFCLEKRIMNLYEINEILEPITGKTLRPNKRRNDDNVPPGGS